MIEGMTTTSSREGSRPRRSAVLGGGTASLTAAYYLTTAPDYSPETHEITVYQLGWRLGGKGASGRNAKASNRIEEHGLHVWMGCYQNAFRLMQLCYGELAERGLRSPDAPLGTWQKAFKPFGFIGVEEYYKDRFVPWVQQWPENDELPGGEHPTEFPSAWTYLKMLLGALMSHLDAHDHDLDDDEEESWLGRLIPDAIERLASRVGHALEMGMFAALATTTRLVGALVDGDEDDSDDGLIERMIEGLRDRLMERVRAKESEDIEWRRFWIVLDLGFTTALGLIRDGVVFDGDFEKLDEEDYREWLARHGASDEVLQSGLVKGLYETAFAYENGDPGSPNFAAGAYLTSALRIFFTYKGSVFWMMQAGMGDTVFAPMYQVLRERGVRFKYFHRVEEILADASGESVETIRIGRQVTLKDEAEYEPLVDVRDLPCWPSEPLYDQLVEGAEIESRGIDLESYWADWEPVERFELQKGRDFDDVVLGISIGAFPIIAKDLIAKDEKFAAMVEHIGTAPTMAFQTWSQPDLAELGWEDPSPVITSFTEPIDTWADMSHLLEREDWPEGKVNNLAYFCGPWKAQQPPPSFSDHDYPERERDRLVETSRDFVNHRVGWYWPKATTTGDPDSPLRDDVLVNGEGEIGAGSFEAQYFRVNVEPTERYVLSKKGTTKYRLDADGSRFKNLALAGDWTRNDFNAGNIEATVISGMKASKMLCGYPEKWVR